MTSDQKRILRRIYKMERVYGFISRLEIRMSSYNKPQTFVYVSSLSQDKIIACLFFNFDRYNDFYDDYKNQKILPFYAFYINLGYTYYYRIDWDDVNLGKYDKKHLHEIAREIDKNGKECPVCLMDYVIYLPYEAIVTLDEFKNSPESEDVDNILTFIEKYEKRHFFHPVRKETTALLKYRNTYVPPIRQHQKNKI